AEEPARIAPGDLLPLLGRGLSVLIGAEHVRWIDEELVAAVQDFLDSCACDGFTNEAPRWIRAAKLEIDIVRLRRGVNRFGRRGARARVCNDNLELWELARISYERVVPALPGVMDLHRLAVTGHLREERMHAGR